MPKNLNLVGNFWKNLTLRFVATFVYSEKELNFNLRPKFRKSNRGNSSAFFFEVYALNIKNMRCIRFFMMNLKKSKKLCKKW